MSDFVVDIRGLSALIDLLGGFSDKVVKRALRRAGNRIAKRVSVLLLMPTRTWQERPNAITSVRVNRKGMIATVSINSFVYFIVNVGAKPHIILPKAGGVLSFQWGGSGSYTPKTRQGSLSAGGGGSSGPNVVFSGVNHTGHDPREFDLEAGEIIAKEAPRIISEEILRALRSFS